MDNYRCIIYVIYVIYIYWLFRHWAYYLFFKMIKIFTCLNRSCNFFYFNWSYTYIVNHDFYICCKENTIKWINLWSLTIIDEKWYRKKLKKFEYFVNIYVLKLLLSFVLSIWVRKTNLIFESLQISFTFHTYFMWKLIVN